jgi:hypothetical protein
MKTGKYNIPVQSDRRKVIRRFFIKILKCEPNAEVETDKPQYHEVRVENEEY